MEKDMAGFHTYGLLRADTWILKRLAGKMLCQCSMSHII